MTKEKLAKKNPENVFALMDGKSLTCGFHDTLLPVDMMEDFMAESGKGKRRLVKSSEIAPAHFDPAHALENRISEEEGSLYSDYLDDFEPSVGINNVMIQGVPLVVYLEMHNIDSDPPSLADGIPVTQYEIMRRDMTVSQSSHETEGSRRAVITKSHFECRMDIRYGRRYKKPPEQKPRYKDILRQTHRSVESFFER